jgi:tRNA-specific 2-thiouridylase
MSGGVDSSVAAGLLLEQGHEVVGATLKLWGGVSDSGCCSVADVDDARRVAQMLGIDHHVFNYTEEFERHVVAPFVEAYAAGRSPNPCIECNRHIKFDLLFERARRLGFDAVATGHHAQVLARDGRTISFAAPTTRRTRVTCSVICARISSLRCSCRSAR